MVTITIGPSKQGITTIDGRNMTVLSATTGRGSHRRDLNARDKLSSVRNVHLIVQTRLTKRALQLPRDLKVAMVEFFNTHHAKSDLNFDCYAFANLVKNQPVHKVSHLLQYWDIESGTELGAGDIAFFLEPGGMFYHAAVHLEAGLFVSVYGAGGDLEFSLLSDMEHDFGGIAVIAMKKPATL